MVSTIRIGPEGGPYVKVEENNGTLDIITPNDTVDLQSNDLVNAALGGIMDAKGNDITNVNQLDANSVNTDSLKITESGVIDHGTVAQGATSIVSISFSNSYSDDPIVLHEAGTGASFSGLNGHVRDVTTSGFLSVVENKGPADVAVTHTSYAVLER